MRHLTDYGLYDYTGLIEKFLNHEITAHQFERDYIDHFLADKSPMSDELFQELDWLFAMVDAFTDIPIEQGEDPDNYLNEEELRTCAADSLEIIRALNSKTV